MISLVFIVLNVRDGAESKYPSIVFLSIDTVKLWYTSWGLARGLL